MGVHMFRAYIGRGPMSVSDLEARIGDWVDSNAEWTEDNTPHTLSERNTELDGSGKVYYGISVRFTKDDAKDNLMQKFMDKLKEKVAWVRVGYHDCSHDTENPGDCSWQDMVEWTAKNTTIPSGIPDFEVSA